MGEEYVGISGLFASLLSVLNLADLGFSSAIIFNMYKPLAEGDRETVCGLLSFYRKIYIYVGSFILVAGIVVTPFLKFFIKGNIPTGVNIYLLFIIYLVDAVVSYFLYAYKSALLNATQRLDISNLIQLIVQTIKYGLQIIVLLWVKNLYIYVMVSVIATAFANIITAYITNKKYPEYQSRGKIAKSKQKEIRSQVGGLIIGKLSDTSRNSFDSIVLSIFLGLTAVTIYNNYYYIYNAVYGILIIITQAMQASVGNSIATENIKKNYKDLRKFQFIFMWIVSWCTICLVCLYQSFMKIWVGEKLLLSNFNMVLFCIYFFSINLNNMRNLYFVGCGLWKEGKKSFLLEAILNLILNIILGYFWGVSGILLATIITIVVFNYVCRTNILFDKYFKMNPKQFYMDNILFSCVTFIACSISVLICNQIRASEYMGIIIRMIVCIFVPNIVFGLCYLKHPLFKEAYSFIKFQVSNR